MPGSDVGEVVREGVCGLLERGALAALEDGVPGVGLGLEDVATVIVLVVVVEGLHLSVLSATLLLWFNRGLELGSCAVELVDVVFDFVVVEFGAEEFSVSAVWVAGEEVDLVDAIPGVYESAAVRTNFDVG